MATPAALTTSPMCRKRGPEHALRNPSSNWTCGMHIGTSGALWGKAIPVRTKRRFRAHGAAASSRSGASL